MTKRRKTKTHCNECLQATNHCIVATRERTEYATDDPEIWWSESYEMLECCGCGAVSLRLTEDGSVNDNTTGRMTMWPPSVSRREPRWIYELPSALMGLLHEVHIACAADARAIAAMGLRAIIDEVANDKVGDLGDFKRKLNGLVDGEFISTYEREVLEKALEVGHAASHRSFIPPVDMLEDILDITEHLLQGIYVLRKKARSLEQRTPKRKVRK